MLCVLRFCPDKCRVMRVMIWFGSGCEKERFWRSFSHPLIMLYGMKDLVMKFNSIDFRVIFVSKKAR